MNARQWAFEKLSTLFEEFIFAVPAHGITEDQRDRATTLLADEFTKIMDHYDRLRTNRPLAH